MIFPLSDRDLVIKQLSNYIKECNFGVILYGDVYSLKMYTYSIHIDDNFDNFDYFIKHILRNFKYPDIIVIIDYSVNVNDLKTMNIYYQVLETDEFNFKINKLKRSIGYK